MKKLILGVTALLLFSACSNEDGSAAAGFESHIQVDGEAFTPSPNSAMIQSVVTSFTEGVNNGEARVRTFHMLKTSTNIASIENIQVSVIYPTTQASIDGTYSLNLQNAQINRMAQGMFMAGSTGYSFDSGNLIVTDLGDNKYKLEFEAINATNIMSSDEKTITGYFEGTFAVAQE